jgi:hypothetical protein
MDELPRPPRRIAELLASERAMQMINATMNSGRSDSDKLARINRVVEAWVFHPDTLTPSAMIEQLPLT